MARKQYVIIFLVFNLLYIGLFVMRTAPVSGQMSSTNPVYLPVVFSPPEAPVWVGPDGGSIISIDVADSQPMTVYAGTWGSGVYRSIDGGITWVWQSQGLANQYINSIAVDPHNARIAYAGTYTGKVYKTVNGGESWFQSSTNIQDQAIVYSIVIDPVNSDKVFIGTRGISNNGRPPWNGVLYRSTDEGNSWVPVLTNVGGSSQEDWAYAVTLHPKNPSLIYAATHEHGIYRSKNSGKTWEVVNNGIDDGITTMSTRGIVVNPNSSETSPIVYTGVWKHKGVFRSRDGGDSWFQTDHDWTETQIYSMSINPKNSNILYAATFSGGVLKTSNGGESWKISGLGDYEITVTAIDPQNPQLVYAGTMRHGLYKSHDTGETWNRSQKGLHATNISAVLISPDNALQYYAGLIDEGVKQSSDGGQNWERLGSDLSEFEILGLVMPPNRPQLLFALTDNGGLYRCNLAGNCWEKISINFPQTTQVAFDSGHPFSQPTLLDEDTQTPAAETGTPALLAISFSPNMPKIAYLATAGAGVYQSMDGGGTWQAAGLANRKIVSVAVNPTDYLHVFAASESQVWGSADGGKSWIDTGLAEVHIYALAVDPSGKFYAGTNNGVYQYTTVGWTHLGLAGIQVTTLLTHPIESGWVYAGTTDGLRIIRGLGAVWEYGPSILNDLTVRAITLDPTDPSYLLIGTTTQGVLRMQDRK
jgi:photosystem II stability/assembly factor-like uncharacterized protein